MPTTNEIRLTIDLDDNKVPTRIQWEAPDSGKSGKKDCTSMMLSIWDNKEKVTLGIDLWTKEMIVDDMNVHVHQTLLKLADTYLRATKNSDAAKMIEDFSAEFANKVGILKKQ
ncbi:MAG: gliding motility protein GldC [Ignavibacteriaceae bacterium]|nr:gliding motility protein GldC [Ignavibacteriaceae bacterium]